MLPRTKISSFLTVNDAPDFARIFEVFFNYFR